MRRKDAGAILAETTYMVQDAHKAMRRAVGTLYLALDEIRTKRLGRKAFSLVKKAMKDLGR